MEPGLQVRMIEYAARHRMLPPGSKVLAAVSGGIDSMVMLHLLHAIGVDVVVAHCNFGLRGEESDGDEKFVTQKVHQMNIPLHCSGFNTTGYAQLNGLSIQMAARQLRYERFEKLATSEGCDAIAVAHNLDDRIETLFINLARGTGVHGLTGIRPVTGKIIRPLLFASREEIEAYAKANKIAFREDSSNSTDKYARNYIRHHVVPGLEQFFPGLLHTLDRNIDHFTGIETFYNETIERYKQQVVSVKGDLTHIDLDALTASPAPATLLYEILKPYGFPNHIAAEALDDTARLSGRQFFSNTHRLLRNRNLLVLQTIEPSMPQEFSIDEQTTEIYNPIRLNIDKFDITSGYKPDPCPCIASLDARKLQYPMLLRKWQHGDSFHPLGMTHPKKLSDFFSDLKLSLIEKERCWVLVSGGQIAWVVGMRISDRFKITSQTKQVICFKFQV